MQEHSSPGSGSSFALPSILLLSLATSFYANQHTGYALERPAPAAGDAADGLNSRANENLPARLWEDPLAMNGKELDVYACGANWSKCLVVAIPSDQSGTERRILTRRAVLAAAMASHYSPVKPDRRLTFRLRRAWFGMNTEKMRSELFVSNKDGEHLLILWAEESIARKSHNVLSAALT